MQNGPSHKAGSLQQDLPSSVSPIPSPLPLSLLPFPYSSSPSPIPPPLHSHGNAQMGWSVMCRVLPNVYIVPAMYGTIVPTMYGTIVPTMYGTMYTTHTLTAQQQIIKYIISSDRLNIPHTTLHHPGNLCKSMYSLL